MIKELLAYQEVDAKLRKIEMELSSSEDRKKALSAKKYIDGVEENVGKLDVKAAELNSIFNNIKIEQEKLQEQEEEFSKAVSSAEDEKEVQYLIKKINELASKIKSLSAEAKRINSEIQSIIKEYNGIRATTKAAQAQYAEYGNKYNELKTSKQGEVNEIKQKLAELGKKVPSDIFEKYTKKRADKIYPVVFEVKGDVCGACSMQLSMAALSKLKNGEVIECDQCRRLLYKSE